MTGARFLTSFDDFEPESVHMLSEKVSLSRESHSRRRAGTTTLSAAEGTIGGAGTVSFGQGKPAIERRPRLRPVGPIAMTPQLLDELGNGRPVVRVHTASIQQTNGPPALVQNRSLLTIRNCASDKAVQVKDMSIDPADKRPIHARRSLRGTKLRFTRDTTVE